MNPITKRELSTLSTHARAEIAQPLAIIQGRAELLALNAKNSPDARNAGRIIADAVNRLKELLGMDVSENRITEAKLNARKVEKPAPDAHCGGVEKS